VTALGPLAFYWSVITLAEGAVRSADRTLAQTTAAHMYWFLCGLASSPWLQLPKHHVRRIVMAGAFSLFIDQQAGSGPSAPQRRVIPIPPPEEAGTIKFADVALSLAYDNFGETGAPPSIDATVRIIHSDGTVDTTPVTVNVGRTLVGFLPAGTLAASVQVIPPLNPPPGFRPDVTAMVEYAFP
jgi:hypothetical protein